MSQDADLPEWIQKDSVKLLVKAGVGLMQSAKPTGLLLRKPEKLAGKADGSFLKGPAICLQSARGAEPVLGKERRTLMRSDAITTTVGSEAEAPSGEEEVVKITLSWRTLYSCPERS